MDTKNYNRFDFGISVSANTYIPLNERMNIIVGINNNLGLTNSNKDFLPDNASIKHNSLALNTGVSMKL